MTSAEDTQLEDLGSLCDKSSLHIYGKRSYKISFLICVQSRTSTLKSGNDEAVIHMPDYV